MHGCCGGQKIRAHFEEESSGKMAAKINHWIIQAADKVERAVAGWRPGDRRVVCASGISPSGPVHLGNLREIMTVHLVCEELRRRGLEAEHIHSWDDYDRLRKVPAGVPESFAEHIGKPLAHVPDPHGEHESYADYFMNELIHAAEELGIRPRYIRQSREYPAGRYTDSIVTAMNRRGEIFDILAKYQTKGGDDRPLEERRAAYYPFRVYCEACGKDDTEVTGWDGETTEVRYRCACGEEGAFRLREKTPGKLVWKVDWPMRWRHEGVDFEPGGEDHSTPGSSFTVGQEIVAEIFGHHPPSYIPYAFVGMSGVTKMSSSTGSAATPAAALEIYEPPMVRWFYIRRPNTATFNINFDDEVLRTYDEWDALTKRVLEGKAKPLAEFEWRLCTESAAGPVARSEVICPFRLLSSAADLTQGAEEQILRLAADHLERDAGDPQLAEDLRMRMTCAVNWATRSLPDDRRTHLNTTFDRGAWESFDDQTREGLRKVVEMMDDHWTLNGLTHVLYGVPKLLAGLPMDASPTEELKAFQRGFFIAIYRLICGTDTGPRLPTLFLSIGSERVRGLLVPEE